MSLKRIIFILVIVAGVYLIINLSTTITTLWQRQSELTRAQEELEMAKKENKDLKSQLEYAQSQEFLEKEARNKLNLVMPGEKQVFIEEEQVQASASGEAKNNWSKNLRDWWSLFVY